MKPDPPKARERAPVSVDLIFRHECGGMMDPDYDKEGHPTLRCAECREVVESEIARACLLAAAKDIMKVQRDLEPRIVVPPGE